METIKAFYVNDNGLNMKTIKVFYGAVTVVVVMNYYRNPMILLKPITKIGVSQLK